MPSFPRICRQASVAVMALGLYVFSATRSSAEESAAFELGERVIGEDQRTFERATSMIAREGPCDVFVAPIRMPLSVSSGVVTAAKPIRLPVFDRVDPAEADEFLGERSMLRQTAMLQLTPFLEPRIAIDPGTTASPQRTSLTSRLLGDSSIDRSVFRRAKSRARSLRIDLISGAEAAPLVTTDIGSLLKKSSRGLSVEAQRRTPIVNDPRIRSSRVGSLAASGSHWVAARADLDTAVSKIDSRLISDVIVIPGPYSSVYGPDLNFIDFELLPSPRYDRGRHLHGRSSFDYQANGNQWLGQQGFSAAASDWGLRFNYTDRSGDDYRDGNGDAVPASYDSREFTIAAGHDLSGGRSIELSLIRLDQTDVEFPGYVFDIDALETDGYQIAYLDDETNWADRSETEIWYNRTRFDGDAQNPAKRGQFPFLDESMYVGFTNVDSISTGYRHALSWGSSNTYRLTAGHDLRFIKQELNEISSGEILGSPDTFENRNAPIPRSFSVNPGLFLEYFEALCGGWNLTSGARFDYVQTDIVEAAENLQDIGADLLPATYAEIIGTEQWQTDRLLWSLYGTLERQHDRQLTSSYSVGYAQRPANLTELYAAQPFLLLLQNGLNNVTGDPELKSEKRLQADFTFDYDGDYLRMGVRGFFAWAFDYITFENTNVVEDPSTGDVLQVSLRYVNTDFATLAGFESFAEWLPNKILSPFATVRYVEGHDYSRNGDFATTNGEAGFPSAKIYGLPRGFFSGLIGSESEPLSGISPLEARIGLRLKNSVENPIWNVEFAARIVDDQNRVARSLLETPTAGFAVFDIRGTYRPPNAQNLGVVMGVENFTDKAYREHLDFRSPSGFAVLQPGANFYFGADLSY